MSKAYPDDVMEAARALRSQVVWASNESVEQIAAILLAQRAVGQKVERDRLTPALLAAKEILFLPQVYTVVPTGEARILINDALDEVA